MQSSVHHHAFHILDLSPWPLYTSLCMLTLAVGLVLYFHKYSMGGTVLLLLLIFLTYTLSLWWRDVIRESIDGCHTAKVKDGLYLGMILFIVSELMFFVGLLWAFLHLALMPTVRIGITWPPVGVVPIDWTRRPTLNTVILATSFFSLNYCKYAMEMGNRAESRNMLAYTVRLGMLFSYYQYAEFSDAAYTFSDSVFGSAFYLTTGFHGMHVILGFLYLIVCLFQINTMAPGRLTMLDLAILYWHFVDVVWIAVFSLVYVWGLATPISGVESCSDGICVLQNVLRDLKLHSFYSPGVSLLFNLQLCSLCKSLPLAELAPSCFARALPLQNMSSCLRQSLERHPASYFYNKLYKFFAFIFFYLKLQLEPPKASDLSLTRPNRSNKDARRAEPVNVAKFWDEFRKGVKG